MMNRDKPPFYLTDLSNATEKLIGYRSMSVVSCMLSVVLKLISEDLDFVRIVEGK